jgi:hypothetical protein
LQPVREAKNRCKCLRYSSIDVFLAFTRKHEEEKPENPRINKLHETSLKKAQIFKIGHSPQSKSAAGVSFFKIIRRKHGYKSLSLLTDCMSKAAETIIFKERIA